MKKLRFLQVLAVLVGIMHLQSNGMNVRTPHEKLFRPFRPYDKKVQFIFSAESGFGKSKGYDDEGNKVNVLQIWNCDQNALAMLDGFSPSSCPGLLRSRIDATDDGVRGHFNVCGDLKVNFSLVSALRVFLPHNLSLGFYVPYMGMELRDVVWQDRTQMITDADLRVKQDLTNDFFANVARLGCLNLCGWKRRGLGDSTIMIEWLRDFLQPKPLLKNVRIGCRLGMTLPTGLHTDEDKIFAIPFGSDGGLGLLFGGGIDLTLGAHIRTGLDVELLHIFGTARERRIKTSVNQTELLLLQKALVFKDFGLTQRFNLYWELFRIARGLSVGAAYQFVRHGEDSLALVCSQFSDTIANSARSLEDWTMHNFFATARYDFGSYNSKVIPSLSAWARIPFNGRRSAMVNTVGAQLSLAF